MAAAKRLNIFPDRPGELIHRCKTNEGTLTTAEGESFQGTELQHSFAAPLAVGDKIIGYETNANGDIVVIKRAHSDVRAIGEVVTKPEFVGVEPAAGTHTYGNYDREVSILFYGQRIRTQTVYVAQSDNLTVNQFLKPCAQSGFANELEETAVLSSRVALDAITASGSAITHVEIPVLEGFESDTTVDAIN